MFSLRAGTSPKNQERTTRAHRWLLLAFRIYASLLALLFTVFFLELRKMLLPWLDYPEALSTDYDWVRTKELFIVSGHYRQPFPVWLWRGRANPGNPPAGAFGIAVLASDRHGGFYPYCLVGHCHVLGANLGSLRGSLTSPPKC